MAAIRYVSSQLSAAGGGAGAAAAGAGVLMENNDDMAQLGTSYKDPRRIVSTAAARCRSGGPLLRARKNNGENRRDQKKFCSLTSKNERTSLDVGGSAMVGGMREKLRWSENDEKKPARV